MYHFFFLKIHVQLCLWIYSSLLNNIGIVSYTAENYCSHNYCGKMGSLKSTHIRAIIGTGRTKNIFTKQHAAKKYCIHTCITKA